MHFSCVLCYQEAEITGTPDRITQPKVLSVIESTVKTKILFTQLLRSQRVCASI